MEQADVLDNPERQRFELAVDGLVAFANYRRRPGRLVITHVEAPPALRGTGAAGRLMQGVVQRALAEGARIEPVCGYARLWLQRHAEYADLVV